MKNKDVTTDSAAFVEEDGLTVAAGEFLAGTIAMTELRASGSSGAERNDPTSFSPEHHTIQKCVFFGRYRSIVKRLSAELHY